MAKNRLQANTSLYNNRKILPSKTGRYTIRRTIDNTYIIIVEFEHWVKSHAINFHNPEKYGKGKEYKTFNQAKNAVKRYGLNLARHPHMVRPLAKMDYYHDKICPTEKRITYK